MAKEKSDDKKKDKLAKKEKKQRIEENGIAKPSKKEKKDKEKKATLAEKVGAAVDVDELNGHVAGKENGTGMEVDEVKIEEGDEKKEKKAIVGAIVPFANPLADDKVTKKVLKGVKKAASSKSLKRGVKEVVKTLRKSAPPPNTSTSTSPPGVVVLAADISPMDVISHIPVLCEDHGIPYVYVRSRAELGAAGSTKRPTSVVMVDRRKGKGKEGKEGKEGETEEEWEKTYQELVRVVEKEAGRVRV